MQPLLQTLARGVISASELRERLGVSRATLMRVVQDAGADVVQIGRARSTRYGLRQTWPSLDTSRFPLFRIDDTGRARSDGELVTLAARQTVWQPEGRVADGLPVQISDARPAGYLGRLFAAGHRDLPIPLRLEDWSDHHILVAASRRGEDLPGNLVVGDESFARWQGLVATECTRADYPRLARATLSGDPPGSSAGGDRPKFGAFVGGRHVLVKFAARGTGNAAATRWSDLLLLEGLALGVVAAQGVPAARAHTFQTGDHCFLESDRFDRVGARGRVSVLSLAAVHGDPTDSWARAAAHLLEAGLLTRQDARHLRWLDAFGALIGNTDRHHYNVVFFDAGRDLRLAPAFDQAPVLYAPSADGQVLERTFQMPPVTADTLEVWDDARRAAREYWLMAADDIRLSDDIRRAAGQNAETLRSGG
jgi:hypothetical protein